MPAQTKNYERMKLSCYLSPVIAAIPSEHPDKDISFLHSLYAWGVLIVIVISTVLLNILGRKKWMYLTIFLALFPLVASYLFATLPLPEMVLSHDTKSDNAQKKHLGLALWKMLFISRRHLETFSEWRYSQFC